MAERRRTRLYRAMVYRWPRVGRSGEWVSAAVWGRVAEWLEGVYVGLRVLGKRGAGDLLGDVYLLGQVVLELQEEAAEREDGARDAVRSAGSGFGRVPPASVDVEWDRSLQFCAAYVPARRVNLQPDLPMFD